MFGSIFKKNNTKKRGVMNFQRQKSTLPDYAVPYVSAIAAVAKQRGTLLRVRRPVADMRLMRPDFFPLTCGAR